MKMAIFNLTSDFQPINLLASDVIHHTSSMSVFQTIDKPSQVSKLVEAQIEEAIRQRKFQPGSKLPSEHTLCAQFGVSRTAVREALRMLSARGMITVTKGKGMFVRKMSADSVTNPMHLYLQMTYDRSHVLDVVHARQIIEPPIAASAAIHHTEEDAARLEKDLNDLKLSNSDYSYLATLDMTFHLDIAKASENPIIPLILDPIHRLLPSIKSSVYASVEDAKESAITWHTKILEEILKRDPEGARTAMTEHLKIAEEHARRMLKAQASQDKTALKSS